MATVLLSDLKPGMKLSREVRDAEGRLLLAAREPISATMLEMLAGAGEQGSRELLFRANGGGWLMADIGAAERTQGLGAKSIAGRITRGAAEHARERTRRRALLRRETERAVEERASRWARLGPAVES